MNLYYYTRVETMRYILMNANIFATNIKYMNDSEEYANGLKELYKIYESHSDGKLVSSEKIEAELEKDIPIYSISFSGQEIYLVSGLCMQVNQVSVLRCNLTGLRSIKFMI